jgi:predicted NBD/HSP70 family sugar kinase
VEACNHSRKRKTIQAMTTPESKKNTGPLVAGVDLGGTAVNSTILDGDGTFLIPDLCEHPARSVEGPAICLQQIVDGLHDAVSKAGRKREDIAAI